MSAQTPLCRGVDIAKIGRERQYQSQRGRQPVDVSSIVIVGLQSQFLAIVRDEYL
jgi:hypothetical protein